MIDSDAGCETVVPLANLDHTPDSAGWQRDEKPLLDLLKLMALVNSLLNPRIDDFQVFRSMSSNATLFGINPMH
jgi:hypothetical protein